MYQRTRVMQRNVRMILILVDGQSTVADLCVKTGNRQLTENALTDLEKGGFVELRVEQDSIWAESKKVAQEIRAAAIDKALQFSSSRPKDTSRSSVSPSSESPISIHSVFNASPLSGPLNSQFSLAPGVIKRASGEQKTSDFSQPGKKKTSKTQPRNAKEELRSSFVERMKMLLPKTSGQRVAKVRIKPIRRGPRKTVAWTVVVLYVFFASLVLGFLTVRFFPYDIYLPEVEAAFSQATGRPVKVGSMRVDVYPKPGFLLGDIRVGAGKDEVRINEIRLLPEISSLSEPKKIFQEVVLNGVSLPAELISGFPSVFVTMAKPTSRAGVKHLRFENVNTSFGSLAFPVMEGDVKLSAAGLFQSIELWLPDRTVSLELKPKAQKLEVVLEGFGWRPSQSSSLLIDSVNLKGSVDNGILSVSNLELHVFDGLIQGLTVLHPDKTLALSGDLSFERINASKLGEVLGIGSQFTGEVAGKVSFSTLADSWALIFSGLSADGEFSMRRGSVRGIDLAEAVRRASSAPVQGGATAFEQLSGKIKLSPTSSQFSGLLLNSGLMQSTGVLEVSKGLAVSGRMELQMRGTANQTRVPISISGSLKTPVVQLGKTK